MAILVRKTELIKGVETAGKNIKISQYADDATFFLRDSTSVKFLIQKLDLFSRLSGLRMNVQKSHLLLLGNHKDPPSSIGGIQVTDSVKILGMVYKPQMNKEEQYTMNFAPRLKKIKNTCGNWSNRNMPLKGKITLINALLISILQYPCSCTFVPERVLVEFKTLVMDFLWDGKRSKIAYSLMIQQIEDGRLKLPDLETRIHTIHLSIIKRIWINPNSTWAIILANSLQARDICQVLLYKADLVTHQPTSYQTFAQILRTWVRFHKYEPETESEVQEEILWNNRDITIAGKVVVRSWPKWKAAGILHINNFIHKEEPRFRSHLEISAEFNISCSFLELLQLRSAIPCETYIGSTKAGPCPKASYQNCRQVNAPNFRGHCQENVQCHPALQTTKDILASEMEWNLPHRRRSFKGTVERYLQTKLQSFQFRITHHTIPCNRYLHNICVRQDDNCSFCDPPVSDTLQHFFYSCPKSASFWNAVCSWLSTQADLHIAISEKDFMLGVPKEIPQSRSINLLVLLVKHFIFRQKLFYKANFDLTHFLRELKQKLGVEKYICTQESRPGKFWQWDKIYNALGWQFPCPISHAFNPLFFPQPFPLLVFLSIPLPYYFPLLLLPSFTFIAILPNLPIIIKKLQKIHPPQVMFRF